MQVKPEELSSHLSSRLLPIYLISGDETLLVEESCDAIIKAARANGFSERSVHHVEGSFKWHDINHDSSSMSLFAERKILDVRVSQKKFDREASDALREWIEEHAESGESMMMIRTTRLEPRQRSSAWFKAIDKAGAVTLIWPMSPGQLPRWITSRLAALELKAEPDAIQYLCDKVEGNLLAAAQEVQKLALQGLPLPITLEMMTNALEDSSRFTAFDLIDAMMAGDQTRVVHVLDVLRQEGVALFAILGALTSQLRRLGDGGRLPPARQRLVQEFSRRIRDPLPVLAECSLIDQQGKGQKMGDAWVSLEKMLLRLAGLRQISLASQDMAKLT